MRIALRSLLALAVVTSLTVGGVLGLAHAARDSASPVPTTYINGNWTVRSSTTLANETLQVNGSVEVQAGAHLTLDNVSLEIQEATDVGRGVTIDAGAALTSNDLVLDSTDPAYHTFLLGSPGSSLDLRGGELEDLGGPGWGGHAGLAIEGGGSEVTGVTFDHYYEALTVSNAPDVKVTDITVRNSTAGSNTTAAVYVFGTSSGFELTGSTFDVAQDVPSLYIEAPYATVTHNTFNVGPNGTLWSDVKFAYSEGGVENTNHSLFENNTLTGTGFIDDAGSYVTISGNRILDTGPNRPYGILVETPLWTEEGLWTRYVTVANNYISDYSSYGIRIQQNVSNFVVTGNTIVNPSPTPGPKWTQQWAGPEINGIYLIRGVKDGVVSHNLVDLSDAAGVAATGVTLESKVSNVQITFNTFLNVSQAGIDIQGDLPGFDTAWPWQIGPSLGNYIGNNLFDNERYVSERNFSVDAIIDWNWANSTTVVNNTFLGWENVNVATEYNGAIVLSTGSLGRYSNNTIEGARWGFVFHYLVWGNLTTYPGEFNRSWNLVYGNRLTGITEAPVVETPADGMGPMENVIDVLSNSSVSPGVPESYVESIGPATLVGASEASGQYTETLETNDPVGGGTQTFTTTIPWTATPFAISSSGGLPSGPQSEVVGTLGSDSVSFSVPFTQSQQESVRFPVPLGSSYAVYRVGVVLGENVSSFEVNSTSLTAWFGVAGSGTPTITASLIAYGTIPNVTRDPHNNTTAPVWNLTGRVVMTNVTLERNLTVELELIVPPGNATWIDTTTSADGTFFLTGLDPNASFANVSLGPGEFTVLNYSVVTTTAYLWNLTIYAELTPAVNNSTQGNGGGGGGSGSGTPPGGGGGGGGGSPPGSGETGTPSPTPSERSFVNELSFGEGLLIADLIGLGATIGCLVPNVRAVARSRRFKKWKTAGHPHR